MPSREEELEAPTYGSCLERMRFPEKICDHLRRGHAVEVFYILCYLMQVLNEAQPYMGFLF